MTHFLSFFCRGIPAPGGSKRAVPFQRGGGRLGVRVWDDCKRNAEWKRIVALYGQMAMNRASLNIIPRGDPLLVEMVFVMPFAGRNPLRQYLAAARGTWFPLHLQSPDATKLVRSTEDALSGIVWADDCACYCKSVKFCGPVPGVQIGIYKITADDVAGEFSELAAAQAAQKLHRESAKNAQE